MHYNEGNDRLWIYGNRPHSINILEASDGSSFANFTISEAGPDTSIVKYVAVHEANGDVAFAILMTEENYLCSGIGRMLRVNADGQTAWSVPLVSTGQANETRVPELGGPILDPSGEVFYTNHYWSNLAAYNATTGEQIWMNELGAKLGGFLQVGSSLFAGLADPSCGSGPNPKNDTTVFQFSTATGDVEDSWTVDCPMSTDCRGSIEAPPLLSNDKSFMLLTDRYAGILRFPTDVPISNGPTYAVRRTNADLNIQPALSDDDGTIYLSSSSSICQQAWDAMNASIQLWGFCHGSGGSTTNDVVASSDGFVFFAGSRIFGLDPVNGTVELYYPSGTVRQLILDPTQEVMYANFATISTTVVVALTTSVPTSAPSGQPSESPSGSPTVTQNPSTSPSGDPVVTPGPTPPTSDVNAVFTAMGGTFVSPMMAMLMVVTVTWFI